MENNLRWDLCIDFCNNCVKGVTDLFQGLVAHIEKKKNTFHLQQNINTVGLTGEEWAMTFFIEAKLSNSRLLVALFDHTSFTHSTLLPNTKCVRCLTVKFFDVCINRESVQVFLTKYKLHLPDGFVDEVWISNLAFLSGLFKKKVFWL